MQHIFKNSNNVVQWHIEHCIKYNGNTDDLNIKYKPAIIGNDRDNVYHLMFKTDYNQLNHWSIMIEILTERFLLYKPKGNDRHTNNKTRFDGKKIKTYLFILKKNKYKLFDWEWDKSLDKELKVEYKLGLVKMLSEHNKSFYDYYRYQVKNYKDTKDKKFSSPLEYIVKTEEDKNKKAPEGDLPIYIVDFFRDLHSRLKNNKKEVVVITKTEDKFCDALTKHIEQMCDTYFGLTDINYDDEW